MGGEMRKDGYAVVVGCANIDICGKSFRPVIERDSNPGLVSISYGGVGKNIAHNLSLLGEKVYMLTAIGGDSFSAGLCQNCERAGIDMSRALMAIDERSSVYLFIADEKGDMRLAVCDAQISEKIDDKYLSDKLDLLNEAAVVVIDCNLTEKTIAFILQNCTAPVFADPVSVTKAAKLSPVLGRIHTLKPNLLEAELLSGVQICGEESLQLAGERLIEMGVQRVFISLGANGIYCAQRGGSGFLQPNIGCDLVNATGGGDAVMAMLVKAYMEGCSLEQTARYAVAAGAVAVESAETVNPQMGMETVHLKLSKSEVFYD